jgi:SNF2 family DNA or RNA helicase
MLLPSKYDEWFKLLGVAGAIASFLWGVWVWKDKSSNELAQQSLQAQRLADSRRIEATKPFLERQLKLYTEASQVAALIATSVEKRATQKAITRFWQLYWGELALVENKEVESAMVAMGRAITTGANRDELQQASLSLAHACRQSLDKSWGIHAWTNPDEATGSIKNP